MKRLDLGCLSIEFPTKKYNFYRKNYKLPLLTNSRILLSREITPDRYLTKAVFLIIFPLILPAKAIQLKRI
jgi:hypothetical protein